MNKPTNLQNVVWVLVMHGDGWWWPLVVHREHTLVHFFGQGQHSLVVLWMECASGGWSVLLLHPSSIGIKANAEECIYVNEM